jgi:ADP-ribose pyrophosphatase YjhB (NUDIX family)
VTRKTRNTGYGSARWLGDEWVDGIARGEHASQAAARELADEVKAMRAARRQLITMMWAVADMIRAKHGHHEADGVHGALCVIATSEEAYGRQPAKPVVEGLERRALLRLVAGESATTAEVDALADEVLVRRAATANAVASLLEVAAAHPDAAEAIRAALVSLAPIDEIYPCPPTDTPPSAASGDPPPRVRSNG